MDCRPALISYLGMRLLVFVSNAQKEHPRFPAHMAAYSNARDEREQRLANEDGDKAELTV